MSAVIAERELTVEREGVAHPGLVRIFAPDLHGDHWRCEWEFSWPGVNERNYGAGGDSYQALMAAIQIIPMIIATTDAYKTGSLCWHGMPLSGPCEPSLGAATNLEAFFAKSFLGRSQ